MKRWVANPTHHPNVSSPWQRSSHEVHGDPVRPMARPLRSWHRGARYVPDRKASFTNSPLTSPRETSNVGSMQARASQPDNHQNVGDGRSHEQIHCRDVRHMVAQEGACFSRKLYPRVHLTPSAAELRSRQFPRGRPDWRAATPAAACSRAAPPCSGNRRRAPRGTPRRRAQGRRDSS